MEIEGKVAWITGGTSGMGLATAKRLLAKGARVMVTARNAERGAAVAEELGENCLFVPADVTDSEAMQAAAAACVEKWGRLDILHSNAGGGGATWCLPMHPTEQSVAAMMSGAPGPLEWEYDNNGPAPLENYIEDIKINLIGAFDAARLAAWEMSKNEPNEKGERGVIVFTSSISATKRHSPGFNCGYSSGKAGLLGLTKEIASNLAPLGIRVNAIIPGYFETDIVKDMVFLKQPWMDAQIFPKTSGDPDNIAQMVEQIVENPFINNATIEVTAGFVGTGPQC